MALTIFDAINSRDLSRLATCLAEDDVFDFPGTELLQGARRILLFFKVLFRKYPRLIFTVDDIIVAGSQVCVFWHNEGEDSSGRPYTNRGVTLVRVRNQKIVFMSDYFKDTSFTLLK